MDKAIEIEELRVSSNGEHIEFIINCPSDYKFSKFTVQVYGDTEVYSIAESLFYDEQGEYITDTNNRFMGQVPVYLFGVSGPSMYEILIEAYHIDDEEHSEDELVFEESQYQKFPPVISTVAVISDVSNVYACLMDDILSLDVKCVDKTIQDRVIRNYLILYAHEQALRLNLVDEAYRWFKILKNCFSPCNNNQCCDKAPSINDCGCQK